MRSRSTAYAHDLPSKLRDQKRLAMVPALVTRIEPVPALVWVCGLGLLRVSDEERPRLGQFVHAGACREVLRGLRAAMQHDDQRQRPPVITAGDVELEAAAAGRV